MRPLAAPPPVDFTRPNVARVYECLLGGKDNYAADRQEAEQLLEIYRGLRDIAAGSRAFLGRAVTWAARQGVVQFADLGTGMPAHPSAGDAARAVIPAVRGRAQAALRATARVTNMKPATRAAGAAAAAGMASFAYQRIAEARDRRRFPPPGRLVDIGGRRLHLVEMGEGTPAVVIIPALADNVLQWLRIVEDCASETRVCVYDRAGIGWSDPPPHGRRTPDVMAEDLYALLRAGGILPPYFLAGHSAGGIVARRFYARYPGVVAGMVLAESSHEDQGRRIAAADWRRGPALLVRVAAQRQARILGVRRAAASLGLLRGFDAMVAREAPPRYAAADRAILLSARQRRASVRELLMLARMRENPPSLDSIPLTVLTRAPELRREWPVWAQLQDELAALSSDSIHVHADRGGHYLQFDEPDLVVEAICDLVRRCRRAGLSRKSKVSHGTSQRSFPQEGRHAIAESRDFLRQQDQRSGTEPGQDEPGRELDTSGAGKTAAAASMVRGIRAGLASWHGLTRSSGSACPGLSEGKDLGGTVLPAIYGISSA